MGVGAALIRQAEVDCLAFEFHELRLSTHIDMPDGKPHNALQILVKGNFDGKDVNASLAKAWTSASRPTLALSLPR